MVVNANFGRERRGDLIGTHDETELLLTEVAVVAVRLAEHMERAWKRACEQWRGRVNQSPTVSRKGDDHG